MKTLYISTLPKIMSGGPKYSIPKQISSQAKFDDVYWINLNSNEVEACEVGRTNIEGKNKFRLELLPSTFDAPDLVVFESVYYPKYCHISKLLRRKKIPYIIVPRSSLTASAQKMKKVKKTIANTFIFNRFIKNALAIQYLTESERDASGCKWNTKSIIIPNGVEAKSQTKIWDTKRTLKGVFIGRMDMYHKGLDYLIDACVRLKHELVEYRCTIDLYGPDRSGAKAIILKKIKKHGLENVISIYNEIYGKEKENILLGSDFFILTSRFEGHPMGLLEALSYGLPCIVTDGSNMDNEIFTADAGWIAKAEVDSLVDSFRLLLKERNQLPQKGRNALMLSENYDWISIAEKTHKAYEELLD